ncbi:hypothetical protein ACFL2Q_08145 [Thermodesulfobacteriota bacterium]
MRENLSTVEEWRKQNSHRLIECRWVNRITREACRAYQSRGVRNTTPVNGRPSLYACLDADYLSCRQPEPCPFVLSQDEVSALQHGSANGIKELSGRRLNGINRGIKKDRLVNPNHMLGEASWTRSLLED